MKKAYILISLLALTALAACHKNSELQGSDPVRLEDAKVLTFKVSAASIGTKSHFADNASELSGETASLVWDETDRIGVIAVPFNPETQDYDFDLVADEDHVCIAAFYGIDEESGNAIFAATEHNKSWWAAKGSEEGDTRDYTSDESLYGIFAYYPANEKTPFRLRASNMDVFSDDEEGILVDHVYAPTANIPRVQDGVNYNNYHILHDTSHIPVIGTIDTGVLVSARDLKDNKSITLNSFKPINAILRFKVKKTADSSVESIDSLRISIKNDLFGRNGDSNTSVSYHGVYADISYYYNSSYLTTVGLTGSGIPPLMFSKQCQNHIKEMYYEEEGDEEWEDWEELMNRAVVSANPHLIPYMDGLRIGDLHTNPSVSARFSTPVAVSTTESDYYYLVVFPTYNSLFEEENVCTARFEAFSGGSRVMMAEKQLPESGFLPGYRYNFIVTLGEGVTIEGSDAGSYTLIDEISLEK